MLLISLSDCMKIIKRGELCICFVLLQGEAAEVSLNFSHPTFISVFPSSCDMFCYIHTFLHFKNVLLWF